jgi:hypothetical protein
MKLEIPSPIYSFPDSYPQGSDPTYLPSVGYSYKHSSNINLNTGLYFHFPVQYIQMYTSKHIFQKLLQCSDGMCLLSSLKKDFATVQLTQRMCIVQCALQSTHLVTERVSYQA